MGGSDLNPLHPLVSWTYLIYVKCSAYEMYFCKPANIPNSAKIRKASLKIWIWIFKKIFQVFSFKFLYHVISFFLFQMKVYLSRLKYIGYILNFENQKLWTGEFYEFLIQKSRTLVCLLTHDIILRELIYFPGYTNHKFTGRLCLGNTIFCTQNIFRWFNSRLA